jgi:antitoxin MazE
MAATVKTRIVRIGNSQGFRVPRALLEQAQLPEEVELSAQPGRLVVRAARRPRAGWAEAARAMHERGHDRLVEAPVATQFDRQDWTW